MTSNYIIIPYIFNYSIPAVPSDTYIRLILQITYEHAENALAFLNGHCNSKYLQWESCFKLVNNLLSYISREHKTVALALL